MDKNNLKVFARQLRNRLREMTEVKINYYLTGEDIEIKYREKQIGDLKKEIDSIGLDGVIEKVSYIWFNRFVALRFMELKGYTKSRILSPLPERTVPEILEQAKGGLVDEELRLDRNKINDLLDGKIKSRDPEEEVYRMLVTGVCNYYHKIMPFMFEWIDDYTELLIPENLLKAGSVRDEIVKNISDDDCEDVEIIGWLYQYYISEKKDEVINAKKRYKPDEIPAATQLFTPKWIVKYMVDNTLGQLWLEARPDSCLKEFMEFYIEPTDKDKIPPRKIDSPEEITIFDPACGSGHILVYAFDLLTKIYEEEGYSKSEIPSLILEKNLYGIDIDDRAASLASFALMMKARSYYRRFFDKGIVPNVMAFMDSEEYEIFKNAKVLGSLIRVRDEDMKELEEDRGSLFEAVQERLRKQARFLWQKYDCVVTNPPYMNLKYMETALQEFINIEFTETKSDIFASFVIKNIEFTKKDGMTAFVTPYVWMFIQTYKWLREYIIDRMTINNLIQLEYNAFEPACVPVCTFTLRKGYIDIKGDYIKLSDFTGSENQPIKTLEAIKKPDIYYKFKANQKDFKKIPGNPLAYWASDKVREIFEKSKFIDYIAETRLGMATANNNSFVREWFEVDINKCGFSIGNREKASEIMKKWFPYNKGGNFRKWYGNNEYLVNWYKDGYEIRNFKDANGRVKSHNYNLDYIFKESITWSDISSTNFGIRFSPEGFIFDATGSSLFIKDKQFIYYILAFLASKLSVEFLKILNPTFHFQTGNIDCLPIIFSKNPETKSLIDTLVEQNISISRTEWDSRETSWDFKVNPLITCKNSKIEESYKISKSSIESQFHTLHRNEEELNKIFIEIYDLQDEFTPDVQLKDITILKDETFINDRGKLEFRTDEVMKQFISYSVGCIFGRYSLDKEGLILANQGETVEDYMKIINQTPSFTPDKDNILPVLSDEYFENDIVSLFNKFLKTTFGEDTFHENLAFIEEKLGKSIRAYFEKDFYGDHVKRYKKRPIYWMFQSPKKYFQALIYMHRYTPDLCSKVLNEYLREYASKQEYRKVQIKKDIDSDTLSGKEKTKKDKEIKEIDKILKDLTEYDKKLDHMAKQYIPIDLDDGVRVNYCKFKDVLATIAGLEKE